MFLLRLLSFFFITSLSFPSLVFRLDDLQCGWEMATSFIIIDVFAKYNIPLSVGVITGIGDCYQSDLLKRYKKANGTLEVASHSVTHTSMTSLSYDRQLAEVANSKIILETLLGNGSIRTFFPPYNDWNYITIQALRNAGYDIISPQCTAVQITWPSLDNLCTSNMYRNRPTFFPRIDGVTHIPTGASEANFATGQLLTINQLFYAPKSDCLENSVCSIQSQVNGMANLTNKTSDSDSWSVIMMHPQDFPDNPTEIEQYFTSIFSIAKKNYRLLTFSQLAGSHRPNVTGIPA